MFVAMVDRLSGGDITKDEMVLKMTYIDCLQRLLYYKLRDEYTEEMNKINAKLNKYTKK